MAELWFTKGDFLFVSFDLLLLHLELFIVVKWFELNTLFWSVRYGILRSPFENENVVSGLS